MIELSVGGDRVADARFDAPGEKVNILNEHALARLAVVLDAIERGARSGEIAAVIFTSAKPGVFLAGADVKAFVPVAASGDAQLAAAKAREGQGLFSRIAALPVPTVAAINGVCLGGGLELALACTARIAADAPEVSIGLPEVRLGLVPGWGGTQRLPRLIGPSRALDLILTGRALPARKAKSFGVVDRVVPIEGLDHAARAFALSLAKGHRPRRPKWNLLDRTPFTRPLVYSGALKRALAQTKGHYPAPPAAIECVKQGLTGSIEEGLALESRTLGGLIVGEVSRNLVQIFLMSRLAPSGSSAPKRSAAGPPRLGVIGAGTMGGGIAAVAAMAGMSVRLKDVDADALARGMKQVHEAARDARRRGRMSDSEATRRESLVSATVDLSGFARCDLVVEAVVEDLEVKRAVLREVEAATPATTVFATNTSSLPVSGLVEVSSRPGRVIGLHFFNPVQKMPLVEIVRGPSTDPDAVALAVEVARKMGKTPVVVGDTPGFVVNRILMPYLGGAVSLLRSGRDPVAVDESLVRFGMPMGPFALMDQIGLDVAAKVAGVLAKAFGSNGNGSVDLLHAMAAAGLKGVKAGKGFYLYSPSGEKKGPSPELPSLIAAPKAAATSGNGTHPAPSEAGTADALVDLMVNEASLLLGQGAVDKPEVIDLAMIMGTGFPPFRGGLLRHADTVGRELIASRLRARGIQPAPLLLEKGRFYP